MSQQISLYIDVQNRQLVRSNSTTIPTSLPDVFQGDTLGLYLEFLNATGSNSAPYTDIDFSAASVVVGIGTIGAQPTAGNFTITDTAATQTTGNIAYNASAATVQAAIQAALTTNWSAATVTGAAGGPYTITNGSNGAETPLVGTSVSLTPASIVEIGTQQEGTSSLPEILYVRLLQSPIALQDSWTPYPAPTATVTELQAGSGTANEIQQITLGNNPYAGAFVVNFGSQTSNPIQWNASPAAVQTALQAMSSIGSGNVSVGGSAGVWVVTFTGSLALASQSLMTTVATGLVGPLALTGTLSLNTTAIEEAIGETDSITETFAIKVTPSGGSAFTCLQEQITIFNDLIVGAPSIPTPGVSYYTEAECNALFLTFTGDGTGVMFPGSLSIASGKTLTASNTLTLTGTDGSTLNIGTGGALGSGAFASAYTLPDATGSVLGGVKVGTGLTATSGILSVDTQLANFQALGSPGTNGFVLSSTTGGTLSWIAGGGLTIGTQLSSYLSYSAGTLNTISSHVVNGNGQLAAYAGNALKYGSGSAGTASTHTLADLNAIYYFNGNNLTDSSANLYYGDGTTLLADASANFYSNLTAGQLIMSGGTGTATLGATLGTGLTYDAATNNLYTVAVYAVASGTNSYTATPSPALDSNVFASAGLQVTITFTNANTGAASLNLNGLGAVDIQWNSAALTGGEIPAGSTWSLVCDGTYFQMIH